MDFYHIVAVDKCNAIGNKNTIPWKSREDMQHFKHVTMGKVVIMGRKTYESLPKSKLPGRYIIIVSKTLSTNDVPADTIVASSLTLAYKLATKVAKRQGQNRVYVAGGSKIYEGTAKSISGVVLSRIDHVVKEADAYYPAHALDGMGLIKHELLDVGKDAHAVSVSYYKRI